MDLKVPRFFRRVGLRYESERLYYGGKLLLVSMNYLFCCEHFAPSVGGVQEVMRQIAERLVARGHCVTVASGAHPGRQPQEIRNGVKVVSFRISGNLVKGMTGEVEAYRRFVSTGPWDAILIKAAQQWSFDAIVDLLPSLNTRLVFVPCGFSGLYWKEYSNYYKAMPAWLNACSTLVFYASEYRDIEFARSFSKTPRVLIQNGADEREFDGQESSSLRPRLGIAPEDFVVLSVGSLIPSKGHWEVMRAFIAAKFKRRAVLIVNGNVRGSSLRRHARDLLRGYLPAELIAKWRNLVDSGKRIVVIDLPRADLVRAFKESDLFAFGSHIEYSPLVLYECVAAGLPFLSSQSGNAAEIAAWTGGGEVVESHKRANGTVRIDLHALSAKLGYFSENPAALKAMGLAGRESFVKCGFSWSVIALRYEDVLSSDNDSAAGL